MNFRRRYGLARVHGAKAIAAEVQSDLALVQETPNPSSMRGATRLSAIFLRGSESHVPLLDRSQRD